MVVVVDCGSGVGRVVKVVNVVVKGVVNVVVNVVVKVVVVVVGAPGPSIAWPSAPPSHCNYGPPCHMCSFAPPVCVVAKGVVAWG